MASKTAAHASHGFGPLLFSDSEILILGSFPSVLSRKQNFFYGHPMNRFWPLLFAIYGEEFSQDIVTKTNLCKRHHVALYDAIEECDIVGSSDSSIRNVVPANIQEFLQKAPIRRIILNGKKSESCFYRYQNVPSNIEIITLPSTSPANAAWSMERLLEVWKKALS